MKQNYLSAKLTLLFLVFIFNSVRAQHPFTIKELISMMEMNKKDFGDIVKKKGYKMIEDDMWNNETLHLKYTYYISQGKGKLDYKTGIVDSTKLFIVYSLGEDLSTFNSLKQEMVDMGFVETTTAKKKKLYPHRATYENETYFIDTNDEFDQYGFTVGQK